MLILGSKFLIKMSRSQNIKMKEQCFAARSSLLIPSTSGDLEHPIYGSGQNKVNVSFQFVLRSTLGKRRNSFVINR